MHRVVIGAVMKYFIFIMICILCHNDFVFSEEVLRVKKATKEIRLSGYTRREGKMTVSSEVSGKVLKVNYDIGQPVGEKAFIVLDHTFISLQIDSTSHSLTKLNIRLKQIRSRVSYLEKEFLRADTLYKGDKVSEVKRDLAAQEFDQARFELESNMQGKAMAEITLKEFKEQKNRHSVYAPKGWIVTSRMVEEGEIVQKGRPLAMVSNYRDLVVPLSVSNQELLAIKALPKEFEADLEGKPVKTRIKWINPEFDNKIRKLNIELLIRDYLLEKRGGLKFTLPLRLKTEGLLVPKAAVTSRYDNPKVTLKENSKVISLLVRGQIGDHLLVAENSHLTPGTELVLPQPLDQTLNK